MRKGVSPSRTLPFSHSLALAGLAFTLLTAGCQPRKPAPAASTPPPPPAPAPTTKPETTPPGQVKLIPPERGKAITPDAAGPLKIGMNAADAGRLPDYTVGRFMRKVEGQQVPTLALMQDGRTYAMGELEGDRVARLVVVDEEYATPEGARVGHTARELKRIYGAGRLFEDRGTVCVAFKKAPHLSFCFYPPRNLKISELTWDQVVQRNPRVVGIVVGK